MKISTAAHPIASLLAPAEPLADPWPASQSPSVAVQRRAIACARQAMQPAETTPPAPPIAIYLPSGWSDLACFRVDVGAQRVFVKVSRTHDEDSLAALRAEQRAAAWAWRAELGPAPLFLSEADGALAFAFLDGGTLTAQQAVARQDDLVTLLRRWHHTPITDWTPPRFYPEAVARAQWHEAVSRQCLTHPDADLLHTAMQAATDALAAAPPHEPVACHTDFHIQNVVCDRRGRLFAVDCEDAGLGDPMWDLASLTANLATMGSGRGFSPLCLADRYGATDAQRWRLQHHVVVCLVLYACWTAAHGPAWRPQHRAAMAQLAALGYRHAAFA